MFTRLLILMLVALGGVGLTMQMAWNSPPAHRDRLAGADDDHFDLR